MNHSDEQRVLYSLSIYLYLWTIVYHCFPSSFSESKCNHPYPCSHAPLPSLFHLIASNLLLKFQLLWIRGGIHQCSGILNQAKHKLGICLVSHIVSDFFQTKSFERTYLFQLGYTDSSSCSRILQWTNWIAWSSMNIWL